jgi:hypothetical protein
MSEAITEEAITETNVREPFLALSHRTLFWGGFHLVRNAFSLCKGGVQGLAAQHGEAIWFQMKDDAEHVRNVWQEGAPGHGYKFDQKYKEKLAVSLGELTPKVRRLYAIRKNCAHSTKQNLVPTRVKLCGGRKRNRPSSKMNGHACLLLSLHLVKWLPQEKFSSTGVPCTIALSSFRDTESKTT